MSPSGWGKKIKSRFFIALNALATSETHTHTLCDFFVLFIFLFFCQLSTVVKLLDSTNLTRKIRSLLNLSLLQDITTKIDVVPPILNTLSNSTKAPKVFLGFSVRLIPTKNKCQKV